MDHDSIGCIRNVASVLVGALLASNGHDPVLSHQANHEQLVAFLLCKEILMLCCNSSFMDSKSFLFAQGEIDTTTNPDRAMARKRKREDSTNKWKYLLHDLHSVLETLARQSHHHCIESLLLGVNSLPGWQLFCVCFVVLRGTCIQLSWVLLDSFCAPARLEVELMSFCLVYRAP